jgi:hypothetical protein
MAARSRSLAAPGAGNRAALSGWYYGSSLTSLGAAPNGARRAALDTSRAVGYGSADHRLATHVEVRWRVSERLPSSLL